MVALTRVEGSRRLELSSRAESQFGECSAIKLFIPPHNADHLASAHGTDELPEEYWQKMIKLGVSKVSPAALSIEHQS